jgi:uncharacterized membrane protein YdbT with pleckstrin-like domain
MNPPPSPAPAAVAAAPQVPSLPHTRPMDGERAIALVLRSGAFLAGLCFLLSILLEVVPATPLAQDAEYFRAAGATLLVVTPVARLLVAGVALGLRGEYRYSTYAAVILALLMAAAGLGFTH